MFHNDDWKQIEKFEMVGNLIEKNLGLEKYDFAIKWNQGNSWLGNEEIDEKNALLRFGIKEI